MKRTISINITVDSETAEVTEMYITEGKTSKIEFVTEGIDSPASINNTVQYIYSFLGDLIDVID